MATLTHTKRIHGIFQPYNLENMNLKATTHEKLGDSRYYLSQYNFKIKYNPGKLSQEADWLSNSVLEAYENMAWSSEFNKVRRNTEWNWKKDHVSKSSNYTTDKTRT